jgi:hypothetical protein
VIQYSRAFLFISSTLEYWVARSSRAMTMEYDFTFSRHDLSELYQFIGPFKNKGRREDRVRAAPAVSCAMKHKENAHEHTGEAEASGLPCAMALRLISCSPRRSGFLVTVASVMRSIIANLTPASRRQDHTTSPYASASFVRA